MTGIVWFLMGVIALLALTQPDHNRKVVALLYSGFIIAHEVICNMVLQDGATGMPFFRWYGDIYFFSAGLADMIFIILISFMINTPLLADWLQKLSMASILYNAIGWYVFRHDLGIEAYQSMYILVYIFAIYLLKKGEPTHARRTGNDYRGIGLRAYASSRRSIHNNN